MSVEGDLQASIEELKGKILAQNLALLQETKQKFASLNVLRTIEEKVRGEAAEIRDYIVNGTNNLDIWNRSIFRLNIEKVDPQGRAILLLTNLLYVVEGPFSAIVNLAAHNKVIKEHHDIWVVCQSKMLNSKEHNSSHFHT
jgi:hypothetical protein